MIIIGERINATRRAIREAIGEKNAAVITAEIKKQDEQGATYIDLNAGTGSGDTQREIDDLCWLVDCALESTEKKLALDAASPEVIERAANHLNGRRPWLFNSIKAEDEIMEQGLSLAAEHGVPIIALAMDKRGIPPQAGDRIDICRRIYDAAQKKGIEPEDLFFDPLVLPISADVSQGLVTFEVIRGIKERCAGARTTMGLSNVSHGLKKRAWINSAFLVAALSHGLDSAICDPSNKRIARAILLGDLLSGNDKHCRRFSRALRKGAFDEPKSVAQPV